MDSVFKFIFGLKDMPISTIQRHSHNLNKETVDKYEFIMNNATGHCIVVNDFLYIITNRVAFR